MSASGGASFRAALDRDERARSLSMREAIGDDHRSDSELDMALACHLIRLFDVDAKAPEEPPP
jgi:hypothetical protein